MEGLETGNESSQVMVSLSLFYLKRIIIIFFFLDHCCCVGFSLVAVSRGSSLVAVYRLLIAVASLIAEHGL